MTGSIKNYSTYIKESDDYDYEEEPDDDDFITNDKFRKFLIDNGALDSYVKNCEGEKFDGHYMPDEFDTKQPGYYIFDAFDWEQTPEKGRYWNDLYNKWNRILYKF